MQKRRLIWLLIAGVVLVGVLVLLWNREPPEPEYGGKKLSEWVEMMGLTPRILYPIRIHDGTGSAIRQIGTNSLPYLRRWICYETPSWKTRLIGTMNKTFHGAFQDQRKLRADGAMLGLAALGGDAKEVIPDLGRILSNSQAVESASRAMYVLPSLGKDALPLFLMVLTNQQRGVLRESAAEGIRSLNTNASLAVPVLLQSVRDTNVTVAMTVWSALYAMDLEPRVIAPSLIDMLQDKRPYLRELAAISLTKLQTNGAIAVPSLLKLLDDPNAEVGRAAYRVLAEIDNEVWKKAQPPIRDRGRKLQ